MASRALTLIAAIAIIALIIMGFMFFSNSSPRQPSSSTTPGQLSTIAQPSTVRSSTSTLSTTAISIQSSNITGKYIMAFLACNTASFQCSTPNNHVTYLAQSNNGTAWAPLPGFKPYGGPSASSSPGLFGSVPDAIRRGNTLYIYNPSNLVRYHLDTNIQDSQVFVLLKYANGTVYTPGFVDPSLIKNKNGNLVLFYLPGVTGQNPAACPAGQSSCTKQFMSATELNGTDGSVFIIDPGARANVSISDNPATASDPAIFRGPNGYYLYISEGQSTIALSSPSLQGNYTYIKSLPGGVLAQSGGVPSGYYDNATNTFWTFVTSGFQFQTIRLAKTNNINSTIANSSFVTVVSGCTFPGLGCSFTTASPGFHTSS